MRVALGSDVGAGTGFSLFKEGLQAYFAQQLLGEQGCRARPPRHLLHLATAAGARSPRASPTTWATSASASGSTRCGCVRGRGTTFDVALRHAGGPDEALAKVFALATPADVARVWVDDQVVHPTAASDRDGRPGGFVRSRRRQLAWPQESAALSVAGGGDGRTIDA